jgi:hypothetical protein
MEGIRHMPAVAWPVALVKQDLTYVTIVRACACIECIEFDTIANLVTHTSKQTAA